ncbi:glycosyltransferase family 2 protein [Calothrix sp. PCC 7507]|uniref:glycosyltransferase family 2 protein n=1 Tax=Calothrix sp. PCC 7507 TaxID=99598 RepID=UPI00029ED76B|nr:glycosyltransferase family 2 protein [Calothrix sp. PCC 7507]AFY30861.1 glycosyl transferase family 2 [Calothrix sp. PCC 7507]
MLSKIDVPIPVFILHWNRPEECLKTLQHFLNQDLPLEISVLDNSSSPKNIEKIKTSLPGEVNWIQLLENKGWGGAFNIVLQQWLDDGISDYCIISAHDTLLENQCLSMLIDAMESDKSIGIICPEYGGKSSNLPRFSPIRGPRLINNIAPRQYGEVEYVDFAHATLLVFRKDCLKKIGVFDKRYFAYGDEYDISIRAKKMGWKVAILWGAIITNPITASSKPVINYLLARNTLLLAKVHGGFISSWCRAILMLCRFPLTLCQQPSEKPVVIAKFLGLKDFLLGRYGKPPIDSLS